MITNLRMELFEALHLRLAEGGHHRDPAASVETEHRDGGQPQLVLEPQQVPGHLQHRGVVTLRRVAVVPRVGDDDGPLGHVVDLLPDVGVVLLPPEQSMLDYQR